MNDFQKILVKYWGYPNFRPLQEDIIREAYNGNDVLGLLPTGGGKSIIFQVAALAKEGVCLVITPLIALMKDQVENLKKRQLPAAAIYSGMTKREIKDILQNASYGAYKFLYLSPERLDTAMFKSYLQEINVNLLAIDEAHCISQWGFDFRPSYRKIADIRQLLPDVPVLALTATATLEVVDDIQNQLLFKKKNVFRKNFERANLIYIVRQTEDKFGYLKSTISKTKGSGIIYVRSRKHAREIAEFLKDVEPTIGYYHAGLKPLTRTERQQAWKDGRMRVIVSTNAFGMGIDKPDVRFVVHFDVPESPEAYFQEAGRAGRDEKQAYAVLLYSPSDEVRLNTSLKRKYPKKEFIRKVYENLFNYYQIPLETGKDAVRDFVLSDFLHRFKLPAQETYNALKILEREGFLALSGAFYSPAKVKILISDADLYKFQIANPKIDPFIKLLLRSYTGLFTDYSPVDEAYLARRAKTDVETIIHYFNLLSQYGIISYIFQSDKPKITFLEDHLPVKYVTISKINYEEQKARDTKKIEAMLAYAKNTTKCRSRQLVEYFGQEKSYRCGKCDVCRNRNKVELSRYEFDIILEAIKSVLAEEHEMTIKDLLKRLKVKEQEALNVIQWLIDHKKLVYADDNLVKWHQ